eukprot:1930558-Pleurochrysis_carterae.AAC.3
MKSGGDGTFQNVLKDGSGKETGLAAVIQLSAASRQIQVKGLFLVEGGKEQKQTAKREEEEVARKGSLSKIVVEAMVVWGGLRRPYRCPACPRSCRRSCRATSQTAQTTVADESEINQKKRCYQRSRFEKASGGKGESLMD